MSFNQIIKNSNALKFSFTKELLGSKRDEFFASQYANDQVHMESRILNHDLIEEDLRASILGSSIFSQANNKEFESLRSLLSFQHTKNMVYEATLRNNIRNRIHEIEIKKIALAGRVSEIRQKLNSLSGFSEGFKFVIKEEFFNLYNLNKELISKPLLNIDLESNVLTLPVTSQKNVRIDKLYISNESRGVPGNYLSGRNKFIYSTIDKNENTFFEFFKLGSGPARLVIVANLPRNSIVNQIKISKAFASASSSFIIKDIKFNNTRFQSKSIKSLLDLNEQPFEINATNKNGSLSINHLPISANSISIEIESNEYTQLPNGEKIFIIGLKDIEFRSIKFKTEGEMGSSRFTTPENLFLLNAETKVFPPKNNSYIEDVSVSLNNGASRNLLNLFNNKSKDLILDGQQNFLNYIYYLQKKDNVTSTLENYSTDRYFVKTDSALKLINKKISPVSYSAPPDVLGESIKVVQSKVLRRNSAKEKALKLTRIKNKGVNRVYIPVSLKNLKIDKEDLSIYGNNILLTSGTGPASSLDPGEYLLNYDENYIELNFPEAKSTTLKLLLAPLEPKIILKNEGYYIEITEPFEYDKRLLTIEVLTDSDDIITELVPKENNTVYLKNENVEIIRVEREGEGLWENVISTMTTISSEAGIFELTEDLKKQHRFVYKVKNKTSLSEEQFEIWGKDNQIKGVFLYPENVAFKTGAESTTIHTKSMNLSNKNIIEGSFHFEESPFLNETCKEVVFIDGYTEFLNIKKIEKDYVPRIEWLNNQVTFTTMQEPYLEGSYADSIELHNESSVLNWSLDVDSASSIIYTITRSDDSSETSEGLYLKYHYLNDTVDETKQYSIDYTNGIVYFNEATATPTKVTYKYGSIKISYDIYNEINNVEFDKSANILKVYSEEFLDLNSSVRLLWHKNEKTFDIEGLEEYYSPIVYGLKIGMN